MIIVNTLFCLKIKCSKVLLFIIFNKHSFFDNYIMDVFLFIANILSMITTAAIVHIVCKHAKLKALLTGIAFQPLRETDAIFGSENEQCECAVQWYTIAALASMINQ